MKWFDRLVAYVTGVDCLFVWPSVLLQAALADLPGGLELSLFYLRVGAMCKLRHCVVVFEVVEVPVPL